MLVFGRVWQWLHRASRFDRPHGLMTKGRFLYRCLWNRLHGANLHESRGLDRRESRGSQSNRRKSARIHAARRKPQNLRPPPSDRTLRSPESNHPDRSQPRASGELIEQFAFSVIHPRVECPGVRLNENGDAMIHREPASDGNRNRRCVLQVRLFGDLEDYFTSSPPKLPSRWPPDPSLPNSPACTVSPFARTWIRQSSGMSFGLWV
jgi:hypothetical protein